LHFAEWFLRPDPFRAVAEPGEAEHGIDADGPLSGRKTRTDGLFLNPGTGTVRKTVGTFACGKGAYMLFSDAG